MAKLIDSVEAWSDRRSDQYKGYEQLASLMREITYERVLAETKAFIGDPGEVVEQVNLIRQYYGEVEPSLQVNFGNMPQDRAQRSVKLFAERVMPRVQAAASRQA